MDQTLDSALTEAHALIEANRHDEARDMLQPLLGEYPNEPDLWWVYLHAVEDRAEASRALDELTRLDPDYPGAAGLRSELEVDTQEAEAPPQTERRPLKRLGESQPRQAIPPSSLPDETDDNIFDDDEDYMTPSQDREEGGRGWLVPALALLVVGALVLVGLLALGSGGQTDEEPTQDVAAVTTEETESLGIADPTQVAEAQQEATAQSAEQMITDEAEATEEAVSTDEIVPTEEATAEVTAEATEEATEAVMVTAESIPELTEEVTEAVVETDEVTPDLTEEQVDTSDAQSVDATEAVETEDSATAVETEEDVVAEATEEAVTVEVTDAVETEEVVTAEATEEAQVTEEIVTEVVTEEPSETPTDEPTATQEPSETPTATDAPSETPTDEPTATEAPSETPLPTAELSAEEQIVSAFSELEVYEEQPTTEVETRDGNVFLVSVCLGDGENRGQLLSEAMFTLAESSITVPGEVQLAGIELFDCEAEERLRAVAVPLRTLEAFAEGRIERDQFQLAFRPVR